VLLSFIITAGLAIVLSVLIIVRQLRKTNSPSSILPKLLNSFSDQQLITGIGIQSVGLAKMNTMVPYHFFIIWMLGLLSTATHLSALLALVQGFKRDWVLRWIRQFLMFVNLVLSCAFGVIILLTVMRDMPATMPVRCAWEYKKTSSAGNAAISVIGTIAVIVGNCIVFAAGVWYLHLNRQRWTKFVQIAGVLFTIAAAVGATVRIILLCQAFGKPNLPLDDQGEKEWSFGQLLTMLILLLPLLSAVEIMRGEVVVPATVDGDTATLLDSMEMKNGRESFQPNPFWGTQSHLGRK
jgi:hypothetical protein